jgi:hypothetical protein
MYDLKPLKVLGCVDLHLPPGINPADFEFPGLRGLPLTLRAELAESMNGDAWIAALEARRLGQDAVKAARLALDRCRKRGLSYSRHMRPGLPDDLQADRGVPGSPAVTAPRDPTL